MSSADDRPSTDPGVGDPSVVRTADVDGDTLLRDVDTAHLRNEVQRRLFGRVVDPVRIARFPVLRRVGLGGMGVVYAAFDNELDRKVAIKLLRPGLGDDGTQLRDRLLREAKALARLSHPAIVQVYEAGEHDGQVYLAMEFVEGLTLRQWLDAEPRSVRAVLDEFLQAGEGLAAAHAAGLVHRDFKPDNVIVGADGRVRVLDFGLALLGEDVALVGDDERDEPRPLDRLTRTGAMLGTPAYMAPEQLRGEPADARSDQFSFAVALHEAIFGVRPFAGETLEQLSTAVLAGEVVSATRAGAASIARVLRRALAPDRDQRHADMNVLLGALRSTQRRPAFALAGMGAVVAVGVGAALFLQRNRDDEVASLSATVESLGSEVAGERTRADDAEAQLRRRADVLTIAEARFAARSDPSLALALMSRLSDDDAAWGSDSWTVAQRSASGPNASVIAPVPEGFAAKHLVLDGEAVIIQERATEGASLWHPWDGRRTLLAAGRHRLDRVDERRWLVQAIGSKTAVLWDLGAGAPIAPIHDVDLAWAQVSVDGSKLVARGAEDWTVVDLVTLERTQLPIPTRDWLMEVGPDAAWVTTMSMKRFDAAGRLVSSMDVEDGGKTEITITEQLGTGRHACLRGRNLVVWEPEADTRRTLDLDPTISATQLSGTAKGDRLAIGDVDGEIHVLDAADLSIRTIRTVAGRIEPRRWLADDRLLFARGPTGGVVIDATHGTSFMLSQGETITDARLDRDGRIVGMSESSVRAWSLDLDDAAVPHGDGLLAIDGPSDDGEFVALRTDGELVRWNGASWDRIGRHPGALMLSLASAGGHVVTAGTTGLVEWSLATGESKTLRDTLAEGSLFNPPVVDASGRWVVVAGSDGIEVSDATDGSLRTIEAGLLMHPTFLSDESRFCVGSHRGSDPLVRCWELATWQELPEVPVQGHVLGFGAGGRIAIRRHDGVAIMERATGRTSEPLPTGFVRGAAFSRDGRTMVAFTSDGRLLTADLESGRVARIAPRLELRDRSLAEQAMDMGRRAAEERRVAFSADGTRVLAIDVDGALQSSRALPPASPGELRAWVRAHAPVLPAEVTLDRLVPEHGDP